MTRKIRPFTLLFSHHVALACLCSFFMALTAPSGAALAENAVPLINQPLVPDAHVPGGDGFTLTVNGTGFVSGSVVNWNDSPLATTFVSRSRLRASVPALDIANAGTASVTVVNPTPGGGTSNTAFFEVAPHSSSVALSAPTAFGTGDSPNSVAVGDFNGDGKLGLAVANNWGNNVSILLGNGDGTFQAAVDYAIGAYPQSVAVGDFSGDGKLDLAVTNAGTPGLSILLGNGDGTFQAAVGYGSGGSDGALFVAVGDFNRDGKLDLAVASNGVNYVSIFLGNGDGTFQAAVNYGAGAYTQSVAVGDFNRDGKLDLAVANGGANNVSILLGKGDGTFQAAVNYATGSGPVSVAVGDFNGDRQLDLAVINGGDNTVSVLLGNGDGTFQAHKDYGTGSAPYSVAVGDFNCDGKLDLAVANFYGDNVSVLLGNGDGTFQTALDYGAGTYPTSVAVGDFTGDGRPGLAVTPWGSSAVSVLLQVTAVALSNTSLNFADQVVGTSSAVQAVTLTNPSGLPLTISSIAITGTNSGDFPEHNNCGSSIAVGGHCTISVTFKPSQIGPRSAAVTITDNAASSPHSVSVSGTGVISGPDATLSATQLTFATQLVGTSSSAQSVTLSDYGTTALSISIAAGGDFSQTNTCGSSLAAGAICTISVTFAPTQIGTRTGTVSITDNAHGSPQTVALSGVGTVVELNPASLAFSCYTFAGHTNCPPPAKTTTLTNTGSTSLTISNIVISGLFSQTNTCGSELVAGGSCTFTVKFLPPLGKGHYSGALSIYDNGGGSPQAVALSGDHSVGLE